MKFSKTLLGLALLAALPGCSSLSDGFQSRVNAVHADLTAKEAWARWSWCYDQLDHPFDFAAGFRAGYQDILNGGRGCPPTLPPRHYWKAHFRNAEGHCRINAWFAGFAHGAIAAEQDGAANYGHIPISPAAQTNLQTAQQAPAEYDWSGGGGGTAPMPGGTDLTAPPLPPDPSGSPKGTGGQSPNGTYESDDVPKPQDPLRTTGRVTLPNPGE